MAVGDMVFMKNVQFLPGGIPPTKGTVVNVPGVGTSDVQWENGEFAAAVDDANLGLMFPPSDVSNEFSLWTGKFVQVNDWPSANAGAGLADSTPKSPGARGLVRAAFGVGILGDPDPAFGILEVEVLDGAGVLIVASDDLVTPPPVTALGARGVY